MARKYRLQLIAAALLLLGCAAGVVYIAQAASQTACDHTRTWLAVFGMAASAGWYAYTRALQAEVDELAEELAIAQDALSWGAE